MKINPFHFVMSRGILGAVIGVITGLFLAVLIWGLEMAIIWISNERSFGIIPLAVLTLPSMCLGAIIGCAAAVGTASREQNKK